MKAFDLVLSVLVETLLLLPSATSSSPTIVVDPKGLGFRVLRGGNSSDDHDFMDFVITAITEMVRNTGQTRMIAVLFIVNSSFDEVLASVAWQTIIAGGAKSRVCMWVCMH